MDWKKGYFCIVFVLCSACTTVGNNEGVRVEADQVEFGESTTLKCFLLESNNAAQVTWTKTVGIKETIVATYAEKSGALVTKAYENRLNMSMLGLNKTGITVYKTSVEDEGCYNCFFNIFPTGSKKGRACLSIPGDVLIQKHHKVRLGEAITLKCLLRMDSNVKQVSWQKNGKNIAIYLTDKTEFNLPEYENLLYMTMEGLNVTAITIRTSRVNDEGNYRCLFNTFPSGAREGNTSLHVYEPLNVTLFNDQSNELLNITCVARARPLPLISWSGIGGGNANGSSSDGILTVTSWIVINAADSHLTEMMQCRVLYEGKETLINVPAKTNPETRLQPTIIALIVVIILVLVVALALVCCRARKRKASEPLTR